MKETERKLAGNAIVNLEAGTYLPIEITEPTVRVIDIIESPDSVAKDLGFGKYNRSIVPGAFRLAQPKFDHITNRWLTGIDELAPQIMRLPEERRVQTQARVKKVRLELEGTTGIPDLSATSTYWENLNIDLAKLKFLNLDVPAQRLTYYVIVANNWILPSVKDRQNPAYVRAKFAFSYPEEEAKRENDNKEIYDSIIVNLSKIKANPDDAKIYLMGLKGYRNVPKGVGPEFCYASLRSHADTLVGERELMAYSEFLKTPSKTIYTQLVVDKAIDKNMIVFKNGVYEYGSKTLGTNRKQAYEAFENIEFQEALANIKAELKDKG